MARAHVGISIPLVSRSDVGGHRSHCNDDGAWIGKGLRQAHDRDEFVAHLRINIQQGVNSPFAEKEGLYDLISLSASNVP